MNKKKFNLYVMKKKICTKKTEKRKVCDPKK